MKMLWFCCVFSRYLFKTKCLQKLRKCSVFAVFFQDIFLKSYFYKNKENALFLLCFFYRIFSKIYFHLKDLI